MLVAQSSASVRLHGLEPARPLCPCNSRQEYWNELPFPTSGGLPDPGIEPGSPALQAGSSSLLEPSEKLLLYLFLCNISALISPVWDTLLTAIHTVSSTKYQN